MAVGVAFSNLVRPGNTERGMLDSRMRVLRYLRILGDSSFRVL